MVVHFMVGFCGRCCPVEMRRSAPSLLKPPVSLDTAQAALSYMWNVWRFCLFSPYNNPPVHDTPSSVRRPFTRKAELFFSCSLQRWHTLIQLQREEFIARYFQDWLFVHLLQEIAFPSFLNVRRLLWLLIKYTGGVNQKEKKAYEDFSCSYEILWSTSDWDG